MQLVWDILRGFALAEAAVIVVGLAVAVYRAVKEHRSGVLPTKLARHVWWVGAGTTVILVAFLAFVAGNFGKPAHWNGAPAAVLGLSIIIYGVYQMLDYQSDVYGTGAPRRGGVTPSPLGVVPMTLYAIVFMSLVVGAYQTTRFARDDCVRNNRQDAVLRDLLVQAGDPVSREAQGQPPLTAGQRKQLDAFVARLQGRRCPSV